MSFLKNLVLIAGGVATGYFASRATTTSPTGSEVELKQSAHLQKALSEGSTMAQFFDSKYGAPFKHTALKALNFAASVKAGMNEKEAELKERFDRQAQDPRPGSLDNWHTGDQDRKRGEIIDSEALPELETEARLRRDAALGKDFFESTN
ncbi:peptide chain release factor 4 [Rothia sp. CCM 9417]|uniref:peptide chain release factor 4 n=1 Tax=unclassified Rothia (in: high G+C Gram-positive bacteria) TaxID=2689056 RepID=UPI003ADBB6A9